MVVQGVCAGCGAAGPVTVVAFATVTSVVILEQQVYTSRLFCGTCAERQYQSSRSANHALHLLPMGHVLAVASGVKDKGELGRVKKQFATAGSAADEGTPAGEDREMLGLLPWAGLLGRPAQAAGDMVVSPAMLVGILALLGVVGCGVGIFSTFNREHVDPASLVEARWQCGEGAAALMGVAAAAFGWERWSARRKDVARDVLGEIFPDGSIHAVGRADVCLAANTAGGRVRLLVAVQNRYDTATTVKMTLSDRGRKEVVELAVEGSEVAMWMAETACDSGEDGRCGLSVGAVTSGSGGRKVRFARRRKLQNASRIVVWKNREACEAAGPEWWGFMGMNGIMRVPVGAAGAGEFSPRWRRMVVWSAERDVPASYAASVAIAFMREAGEGE